MLIFGFSRLSWVRATSVTSGLRLQHQLFAKPFSGAQPCPTCATQWCPGPGEQTVLSLCAVRIRSSHVQLRILLFYFLNGNSVFPTLTEFQISACFSILALPFSFLVTLHGMQDLVP